MDTHRRGMRTLAIACLAFLLCLPLASRPVSAAVFTVTTCTESAFRAQVTAALAVPGSTVTFACDGTIPLTGASGGEITISSNLTIDGAGRRVTIDGGNSVGLFHVNSGIAFTVNALTLANGAGPQAGGIYSQGTLTVTNTTMTGNANIYSGAIHTEGGNATVTNSTFSGNSSPNGGAAIDSGSPTLTVRNSTFSGNSSTNNGSIYLLGGSTTLTGNIVVATTGGGEDVKPDFGATLTGTYNLLSASGSSGFVNGAGHNIIGQPALLGSLSDNGGPTHTFSLQAASPARGAGDPVTCAATGAGNVNGLDQRGSPRPTACAIGAYEPAFIAAVSPPSGSTAGGYRATLIGGGFFPGATVHFGAAACASVSIISPGALTCTVPAGTGTVAVTATTGGSSATKASAFTYGTVTALPGRQPGPSPGGGPVTLPGARPNGPTGGPAPNPLPGPRP